MLLKTGVPAIKVGSDDLTNLPLLEDYSKEGLPMLISTGMGDLADVHQALYASGWYSGKPVIALVCTSEYPTPKSSVNLSRIKTLKGAFPGLIVGFSDHTEGSLAASIAVGLGACVFEKHFTLDNNLPGPDHWFSENPAGLKNWVESINDSYKILGNGLVLPSESEMRNKLEFQRVIVALKNIRKGELFTSKNLGMRRISQGVGFAPNMLTALLGKAAWRDFNQSEPVNL